jgi:4a-hydroxytetrahydrobiopterin dehydratase
VPAASVPRRRPAPAGWLRVGTSLVRQLSFRDFDQAIAFVQKLAATAEDHFRRPDMCVLEFNHVRLMISNPNHAGLTESELRLAEKVNAVIDR